MKSDIFKKILRSSAIVTLYLLYIVLWIFIVFLCILANINGMFYTFVDAWGNWSVYVGFLLAVMVFFSPLFLMLWRKKHLNVSKILIPIFSIFITGIFLFFSFATFFISASQFRTFTEEKWKEYPRQRYIMLDDMKEKHGIVGMTSVQIAELLGKPDEVTLYESWIYDCEYNSIEVRFDKRNQLESINLH